MAPSLELSIPTTTISASSPPYTLYTITLRQPLRSWTIQKRYSDFTTLHATLTSQCNNTPPPLSPPAKSWFKKTVSSPQLTETRRKGLEEYMQKINTTSDPRWRNCAAWRQFLNLPNINSETKAGKVAAAAMKSADLQAPVTDPNVWLDVHRDLKAQLRDARVNLTKRDQANTAQEQHEASGDARRCLVRSGTMITSLEAGLSKMVGADAGIGEGELRRRRDLITSAKKEKDALKNVLTTFTPRNTTSTHEPAAATAGDKASLFQGPGGATPSIAPSSGRRVLGAKETARTRELDNAGVLQLQKQIMSEQDQDVTDLTKVVTRMKQMGITINDELQLQNEMLSMLDQDVDRNEDKLRIAKKRVDKIK